MADNDIKEFDPASGEYKDLPTAKKESAHVGNADPGNKTPEAAKYQFNVNNNNFTPPVTEEDVAKKNAEVQVKVNNITNGVNNTNVTDQAVQNDKDAEEYNKKLSKPASSSTNYTSYITESAEEPDKQYINIGYRKLREDLANWISSPNSYTGPYADFYKHLKDPNGWLSQLNSLDSTSSSNEALIDDVSAHLKGALKIAKESGISPDDALFNLTAVAQAARNGDAKAGIEYFLTTGIVKNKAAAKYIDDVSKVRALLDNGKINEDQYKEELGKIAQDIVKNEKYFDRSSNVKALTDSIFELGGYAGGVLAAKATGKLLSNLPNSKLFNWFANTRVGRFFTEKGANKYLNEIIKSIKNVPLSEADAKVIQACTSEDEAAFETVYRRFIQLNKNGGDAEFLKFIEGLPSKTQESIKEVIAAYDTIAKVNPEAFAAEALGGYLDPDITPEAAKYQYNVLVNSLKNRTKFNAAELARFLNINSKEQAGGLAGFASAYFNNLTPYSDTTSGNVTGGKGAEGIEPMPSAETTPLDQNKVDKVSDIRTSKYLFNSPELEEAYNRVKEAEKAFNDAPAPDKAVAKKQLDEAINDYNNKLNAAENDLLKEMPNKLKAMDNSQVNMRQFWKSSLGRSILDAYASGEISGGQALYFSIQALAEGILNASRGIATGIHGEGLQDMKPSTWDTLQKTRTSEAYSFRNQQLNQMANDQISYVSDVLKLDADSQKKVRDLMSDAITRNYYNKLDDSRKLEFIELLAAYAPKYVRFNDDQKKVFRQIMMESGQITPDDINLMISQFGMSGIASLIHQGKESMMHSEYWKSVSNKKEVEEIEKKIGILESEGKIKSQEAAMYKLKLYTEASKGGVGVLKEILGLVGNK